MDQQYLLDTTRYEAVIFDMDGVVTQTADLHAAAWKELFDGFLRRWAVDNAQPFEPFDAVSEYRRYVDGKARYDGVRDFLAARGISLPTGNPSDPPDRQTICGLGNRKDAFFLEQLRRLGAEAFASTIDRARALREKGLRIAVISASRNAPEILTSAGVADLFEARVDGLVAAELGLPGKPDPAVFLEAARRLGADPARTVVIEDATAGVDAGRRGGFGLVIGVDRAGQAGELRAHGADVVINDLAQLELV
jgi:alpha,alpha-trehalase